MMRTALRQLSGHCADGPIGVQAQSNSRNRVAISPLIAEGRCPPEPLPEADSMCCGRGMSTRAADGTDRGYQMRRCAR